MIGMKIEIFVPVSVERGIGVDKFHAGVEAGGDILKLGPLRRGGAAVFALGFAARSGCGI